MTQIIQLSTTKSSSDTARNKDVYRLDMFQTPPFKTNRFKNDFINCNLCKYVIESN